MLTKFLAALTLLIASVAAATAAEIRNRQFESGNLEGWTVVLFDRLGDATRVPPELWGYAAAVAGPTPFTALRGGYSAVLAATDNGAGVLPCIPGNLFYTPCPSYPPTGVPTETTRGPSLTNALLLGDSGFYNGAYIGQDFDGHAGDVLTWTWARVGEQMDVMFAALSDGKRAFYIDARDYSGIYGEIDPATRRLLSMIIFDVGPRGVPWDGSFTLPSDGLWTLYFGIGQTGDNMGSSWMQLDDVRLEGKVSEPSGAVLLVVGLLALVVGRARRAP